jgi:hypothetical protein
MNRHSKTIWVVLSIAAGFMLATIGAGATPPGKSSEASNTKPFSETIAAPLPSVDEARGRARLLYETIQATLQVVHHEYYREDEKLPIPARALKKVFRELADRQKVEIRWLAVTGQAMNQDHLPQTDFEKKAVSAIASGAEEYELTDNGIYRHASVITLTSECLKCHLPNRTSTKSRAAGLVIVMPIEKL